MKNLFKCYIACEPRANHKCNVVVKEKNSDARLYIMSRDVKRMKDWQSFCDDIYHNFSDESKLFSKTDMSEYLLIEGNVRKLKGIDDMTAIYVDNSFYCTHQIESEFMPVQFTPKTKQTAGQCLKAVKQNGLSLEYVSKRFHTESLYLIALQQNWHSLQYVQQELFSTELAIEAMKQNKESAQYIPPTVRKKKDVIKAMHTYGVINITFKGYQKKTNTFLVKGESCIQPGFPEEIYEQFDSFDKFYHYLYGNLLNAELSDYDFAGIDLKAYNLEQATIPAAVLEKAGMYDDTFYTENVRIYSEELEFKPSERYNLKKVKSSGITKTDFNSKNNDARLYYISDIHLDEKIRKKFPECATKQEITCYIQQIVKKIVDSRDTSESDSTDEYLLVAGDVSSNYNFAHTFYEELARQWGDPGNIIAIIGNHELWGFGLKQKKVNYIVGEYRNMFERLGISSLHNEVLVKKRDKLIKITEIELREKSEEELQTMCNDGQIIILGGTGFSGYNHEHNAASGLYRLTLNPEGDMEQTTQFNAIYTKLEKAIHRKKVIVLTHMQKEDWLSGEFIGNWIYVSGHTHKNALIVNNDVTLYADNQVGYNNTRFGLKSFPLSINYDIFLFFDDGIHEISRMQYSEFHRGLGIQMQLNRTGIKIFMLKRKGIYCFLQKKYNSDGLYILNGGKEKKLPNPYVNYYYYNLEKYAMRICDKMNKPNRVLERIAKDVKLFGGSGYIHGCIVDIDYFNHIYLNPYDGKLTPYYATSIVDKYVYPDLSILLSERCPQLYGNYMNLVQQKSNELMIFKSTGIVKSHEIHHVKETDIYRASRVIRELQYTTEYNIIRTWDEKLLNTISDADTLFLE